MAATAFFGTSCPVNQGRSGYNKDDKDDEEDKFRNYGRSGYNKDDKDDEDKKN
ncbi:hypothetical protein BT67DRAFT_438004 [Trichocladium antarcticum]|uniref:Uncharacterized protein n=1 Tax=Trichocladium antarcticum TaxID=1450529 RepID=A0AAN6ZID6_9PEZI|nr:hypothetical protein BT67DRAFT_438004 [Trichocladium antarcticum]